MRLAYLVGYGSAMERSPVNRLALKILPVNKLKIYIAIFYTLKRMFLFLHSASLSMLPWPKPSIWPSVPSDASSEVLGKEKVCMHY